MKNDFRVIHFKQCRVVSEASEVKVDFNSRQYTLTFESTEFLSKKGIVIKSTGNHSIESDFLAWLSVYFGEDFLNPYQEVNTLKSDNRGDFHFHVKILQRFLTAVERTLKAKHPKWRKQLFEYSLTYFTIGVRSQLELMPVTMGFFGVSLECIGNIVHNKPEKYQTLGELRFKELINRRFARHKKNDRTKVLYRNWQKYIEADVNLILLLRNMCYGHFFLHTLEGRMKVVHALRAWYVRSGASERDARWFFKEKRLELDLQVQAAALYKVGLRTNRLLLFMLLGFSRSIPFAKNDYLVPGDRIDGETKEHKGMKISIRNI